MPKGHAKQEMLGKGNATAKRRCLVEGEGVERESLKYEKYIGNMALYYPC
jgi:hypothetical protein